MEECGVGMHAGWFEEGRCALIYCVCVYICVRTINYKFFVTLLIFGGNLL